MSVFFDTDLQCKVTALGTGIVQIACTDKIGTAAVKNKQPVDTFTGRFTEKSGNCNRSYAQQMLPGVAGRADQIVRIVIFHAVTSKIKDKKIPLSKFFAYAADSFNYFTAMSIFIAKTGNFKSIFPEITAQSLGIGTGTVQINNAVFIPINPDKHPVTRHKLFPTPLYRLSNFLNQK